MWVRDHAASTGATNSAATSARTRKRGLAVTRWSLGEPRPAPARSRVAGGLLVEPDGEPGHDQPGGDQHEVRRCGDQQLGSADAQGHPDREALDAVVVVADEVGE